MSDRDAGPLGIVDWGIGGIGFYRRWRARYPGAPVIYWSDTGATPYGKLSRPALQRRLAQVVATLAAEGATRVVVACNAASTVASDIIAPVPITGILAAGVDATLAAAGQSGRGGRGPPTIAVIGGARTIRSGHYRRALAAAGHPVRQRIAQPLSALIEAGCVRGPELDFALTAILTPLRGVDVLLLACTHYPAVAPHIAAHLPGTQLIDPIDRLVASLPRPASLPTFPDRFLTTGDPTAMRRAAHAAFAVDLPDIEAVTCSG